MDDTASARIQQLVEGLKEIREISSLKRLEASVTDDVTGRLRVAGQALERIDVIVNRLLLEGSDTGQTPGGQSGV